RRRDGVAPRDVLVPADVHDGRPDQAGAGDVVGAGDRQLLLGEPVAAAPREVRVAEHHAAPGRGGGAPDGGGIGAERRVRVLAQRREQLVAVRQLLRRRLEGGVHWSRGNAGVIGTRRGGL